MTFRPEYIIFASWGPRAEPPESIAPRYLACTDRLKQIHPAYDDWIFDFNGKPKKYDALRGTLAGAIAANVDRAENGKPTPIYGYWATVTNTMRKAHPSSVSLRVNAGAWVSSGYFCNSALIKTATRIVPDPSIIAYPAFRRRSSASSRVSMRPIVPPILCKSWMSGTRNALSASPG